MDGIRSNVKDLIAQYLIRNGLSTQTGQKGHEVKNPRRHVYPVKCPICGTRNLSVNLRCKGCDAFLVQKKPTGTAEQQVDYLKDYADNYDAIAKAKGFDKPKPKATKRKVEPSE